MGFSDWVTREVTAVQDYGRALVQGDAPKVQTVVQRVADDHVTKAITDHPVETAEVGVGAVLVITGVGAVAGAGLIANGARVIVPAMMADDPRLDDPKLATPGALQVARARDVQKKTPDALPFLFTQTVNINPTPQELRDERPESYRPGLLEELKLALHDLFSGDR
jgi:hypothetical protein